MSRPRPAPPFERRSRRAFVAASVLAWTPSCAAPPTSRPSDVPLPAATSSAEVDLLAPSTSPAATAQATSSSHAVPRRAPTRGVWGEITRDATGVVWIEERIEILPAMLEASAGADWASRWIGVQADMELEIGVAPCVPGARCPLGACRMQVEKIVSIDTFDGKPEWQRPSPKRRPPTGAPPGAVRLPDFAAEDANRCAQGCASGACDDAWVTCVENCLFDVFPPSGTSTR